MLCLLLLIPLLRNGILSADAGEETAELTGIEQVEDGLDERERAVGGELKLDGSYDAAGALGRLAESFRVAFTERLLDELGFGLKLVLLALSCGLCSVFGTDRRFDSFLEIAACCGASLLLAGGVGGVFGQAEEALYRLSDYAGAAFPAFFTTVAACGTAGSAAVKYAAVSFVMDLFLSLSQKLILPLIHAHLAVSVCCSLFENALLKAAARFTKWCAVTILTLLTMGFCTYISLSGLVSASADAAAVKTAKSVISTTLPVVGGILSDSAAAILSAAAVIRNSAGVFCLIAVCAICCGPFALLSVKMLVLKGASALSELCCGGRLSRLLGDFGSAFGLLLAMVGCGGFMLFYSFLSGIRMTGA